MLGTSNGLPRDKDLYNDNNNDLVAFCQMVVTCMANGYTALFLCLPANCTTTGIEQVCTNWMLVIVITPWSASVNPTTSASSLPNTAHHPLVPFRYLSMCFAASQCTQPRLWPKQPSKLVANATSGQVPRASQDSAPTICLQGIPTILSLSACAVGQSALVSWFPSIRGIVVGTASARLKWVGIESMNASCDIKIILAVQSHSTFNSRIHFTLCPII